MINCSGGELIVVIVVFFLNRVSLCSPGWPRTSYFIDQADLKSTEICISLIPLYWRSRLELPTTPGFNGELLILLAMLHFN